MFAENIIPISSCWREKSIQNCYNFSMKLKFVDLNIWLGGKIFEPMFSFLRAENADILTLQEVQNGQSDNLPKQLRSFNLLKDGLGYEYGYFAPCFLNDYLEYKTDRGNAILSHFPIKSRKAWFFDTEYGEFREGDAEKYPILPRTLQHTEIEVHDATLNVFNTQGVWDKDGLDNPRRLRMGEIIADKIKNMDNVILAGDFNMEANTKSIGKIAKYLKNVFEDELTTSFNMRRKTDLGYATAVVDMVFVSPDIKVLNCKCPDVDISDHLPLVCTFEV